MPRKGMELKGKEACWVCEKTIKSYAQHHHVVGVQNDVDLKVTLCRGCHYLERQIASRKMLADTKAIGRLLTLARFHAGLPDARTVVEYQYTKEG